MHFDVKSTMVCQALGCRILLPQQLGRSTD